MIFYQKYNFVFFAPLGEQGHEIVRFNDLYSFTNVRLIHLTGHRAFKNGFLDSFMPIRPIQNPGAFQKPPDNIFFGDYFKKEFPLSYPIIFVFFEQAYYWLRSLAYFEYLKTVYPDCKLVLYLINPVHWHQKVMDVFSDASSIKEMHATFDCIVTYLYDDAMKFGLTYFDGWYSILPIEKQDEIYDIFFIGAAKDRLDKIHKYYRYFKENGFKCDFYVTEVFPELQKFPYEIHYNQAMPYRKVLEKLMCSRGVLEVAQANNYGLTLRYFEALVYDKNFITDNGFFSQEKFLSSQKLFYIPPYSKLNIDKEKYSAASKLSNNYKGEYSPVCYLKFLEAYFNSK